MPQRRGSAKPFKEKAAKKTRAQTAAVNADIGEASSRTVPVGLQQKCLNIFRDALNPAAQDSQNVQEVKGHLFNRDFSAAFGKEEYLRVYASRWSPSRSLGYSQILADIQGHILSVRNGDARDGPSYNVLEVVCLGGGAGAELVALGALTSMVRESFPNFKTNSTLVDIAAWDSIVADLHRRIVSEPELSKYASTAAREANRPLIPEDELVATFIQKDVLDWPEFGTGAPRSNAKLVTMMFVLNELYSTSMQKTQRLLSHLTSSLSSNSFLLVVDSPGSYSMVSINGTKKKYPMQWLLDLTLLGPPPKVGTEPHKLKWEKLVSDESRWFRLPQGLQYPIDLENMRYQIHLYKRLGEGSPG